MVKNPASPCCPPPAPPAGKDVVIVGVRRIMPPAKHSRKAQRPRTRTLTAVHEAYLDDLVYPTEIVGKRIRYR